MAHHLQDLVDTSIGLPETPGLIKIDLNALRTLLLDLIRACNPGGQTFGRSTIWEPDAVDPSPKGDEIVRELEDLQTVVRNLQLDCRSMLGVAENTLGLKRDVNTLKENMEALMLKVDSIESNEKKLQVQMDAFLCRGPRESLSRYPFLTEESSAQLASDPGDLRALRMVIADLVDRSTASPVYRVEETGSQITTTNERTVMSVPARKFSLSAAFEEFLGSLDSLRYTTPDQIQDFFMSLQDDVWLSSDMIQELLLILSPKQGVTTNFIYTMVSMLEDSCLTIDSLVDLLSLFFTSPFNTSAFVAMYTAVAKENARLTPKVLKEILEMLVSASKVSAAAIARWLKFLSR
ncbi:hypothetical protein BaRGS_00020729 [Batillaria attramentaria]|uniref:Uncharacterized protein n=1 Tax=Batillaria attramentaria TaxID=370345 RepID=A0ABD0KLJ1_9CAEN